jgi:hypothetical protein
MVYSVWVVHIKHLFLSVRSMILKGLQGKGKVDLACNMFTADGWTLYHMSLLRQAHTN